MPIELSDDTKQRLVSALHAYFGEQFDIDLGILQSKQLLEFLLATVGAVGYNQAVKDAQAYMQTKTLDLEGDLHEPIEWGKYGVGRTP